MSLISPSRPVFRLRSIFLKATAITALTVAVVSAASVYRSTTDAAALLRAALQEKAGVVTSSVGHDAGGGLRFNKPEATREMEAGLFELVGSDIAEVLTLRLDGSLFSQSLHPEASPAPGEAQALGNAMLAKIAGWTAENHKPDHSEELIFDETGLIAAHPVYFGAENQIVGALVTRWSDDRLLAQIAEKTRDNLIMGGGIFTLMLVFAGLMFRQFIASPLRNLNVAVTKVAERDYTIEVPGRSAGDEVGDIARALEKFRTELAASVETTRVGMFKGSGFEGASAALMITDADFVILFANPALDTLMATQFAQAGAANTSHIGRSAVDLDPALSALSGLARSGLPQRLAFTRGRETFEVAVAAVTDQDNATTGYVLEWRTTTQDHRNAAVLSAIDAGQLRAELSPNGMIEAANEHFAILFGQSSSTIIGKECRGLLRFDAEDQRDLWTALRNNEPVEGLLHLTSQNGGPRLLEARLNPIKDGKGVVKSYLMLATDATQRITAQREAESSRRALEESQTEVVNRLRAALSQLSNGDLTATLKDQFATQYEGLRNDFNEATDRLRAALSDVVESSVAIRGEVSEISSAADNLSRRTEQQAATLEQTSAALDQMTSSVKLTSEVATHANAKVEEAKHNAETSGRVVREAVSAMGEIEQSSSKISRITSVIDEIAFQTNLLALNAGVEAARAGEAGRGFAVVASEVRDLAQRSSEAAREIAGLITDSSDQVKRGVSLVAEAGRSLTGIQSAVGEIHGLVSEIAMSAKEQSNGIAELNTAVKHLDQVTQQNAAMFEETSAASQSLNRAAGALADTTERFTIQHNAPSQRNAQPLASPTARSWGPPKVPEKSEKARFQSTRSRISAAQPALNVQQPASDGWEDF